MIRALLTKPKIFIEYFYSSADQKGNLTEFSLRKEKKLTANSLLLPKNIELHTVCVQSNYTNKIVYQTLTSQKKHTQKKTILSDQKFKKKNNRIQSLNFKIYFRHSNYESNFDRSFFFYVIDSKTTTTRG